jgi:enoyl-CoA hydratase
MGVIHLIRHGRLAELRLDNPAKLNCLTPAMLADLARHCDEIDGDAGCLGVVVTAEGERAFCTGADITAWADLSPADFARSGCAAVIAFSTGWRGCRSPLSPPCPAPAFGGGLELAAACDIRVMVPSASLALPEAGVGIVPGWSGTQRLMRLLPEPVVKEMALFGRRLSAERALALGFVAEVAGDARQAAFAIAGRLETASPRAVEVAKYMIHAAAGEDGAAMVEALGSGMIGASADKAEGVAAFRAKRKPEFPGE